VAAAEERRPHRGVAIITITITIALLAGRRHTAPSLRPKMERHATFRAAANVAATQAKARI